MAGVAILDAVAAPSGAGGGDDRHGFDEAAGRAWVVDGATDVAGVRLFARAESDAAWHAAALSARFLDGPGPGEGARAYLARAISDVAARAEAEAVLPLATAPREALPSSAFLWLSRTAQGADLMWLGDCVALLARGDGALAVLGDVAKVTAEDEDARRHAQANTDAEARWRLLRAARALMNTPQGYWIASLHPEAADHAGLVALAAPPDSLALLMTDGFYRLVAPYGLYDAAGLLAAAKSAGLGALVTQLRAYEDEDRPDHAGRVKRRDDATALLVQLT